MRPTEEWLTQPGGLAERLRALRRAAGLTGDQLAARLGWSRSKVPKIENGHTMPSEADITTWARACGSEEAAPELLGMLAEGQAIHQQWRHQRRRGHAAIQAEFDRAVREGKRIRDVETFTIPGLLQTPEYARWRVLEAVRLHGFPEDQVDATVAARMRRQEVLYEGGRSFEFIVTEAALRFLGCPPDVMLGQLDRLAALTGLPGVTFAIVPMGVQLAVIPMNEFLIADDVTYLETHTGLDTLHGEESAAYGRRADQLLAGAVTGEEARHLIAAAASTLR